MGGARLCSVHGCDNHTGTKKQFFGVPKVPGDEATDSKLVSLLRNRRAIWLEQLGQPLDTPPSKRVLVCADHFIGGKPATAKDPSHIDWAPSLNLPSDVLPAPVIELSPVVQSPEEDVNDVMHTYFHTWTTVQLCSLLKAYHLSRHGNKERLIQRIATAKIPLTEAMAFHRSNSQPPRDLKKGAVKKVRVKVEKVKDEPTQWVVIDNELRPMSSSSTPTPIMEETVREATPLVIKPVDCFSSAVDTSDDDSDSCPAPITYFEDHEPCDKQSKRVKKKPKWMETYQTELSEPKEVSDPLNQDALKAFLQPLWAQTEIKTEADEEDVVVSHPSATPKPRGPRRKRQRIEDVVPGKENFTCFKERQSSNTEHGQELRRRIQLPHWLDVYSAETSTGRQTSRARKRKR